LSAFVRRIVNKRGIKRNISQIQSVLLLYVFRLS